MAPRRSKIEKLYAYYQASSGVSETPNNQLNQKLYFAFKVCRPNSKIKIPTSSVWCWLEAHAPSVRETIYQFAAQTRWGDDLQAALEDSFIMLNFNDWYYRICSLFRPIGPTN